MSSENKLNSDTPVPEEEIKTVAKRWETPSLRVLPIPTSTQGQGGNKKPAEGFVYKVS